jgi:GAF domain-containing protein
MQAIDSFKEKDLSLIRTLAHQAAISIENSSLLEEIETELRIVDQLGRFLPPQVVDKVVRLNIIGSHNFLSG